MDTAAYFAEKARQCRRLSRAINDARAIEGLHALASEFETKAMSAEARERTVDLLGNGKAGRLTPDDDGDTR